MKDHQKESHIKAYKLLIDEEWTSYLIDKKDYYAIHRLYGYQFLLIHLESLEKKEDYESCQDILKFINRHNSESEIKIPTRL